MPFSHSFFLYVPPLSPHFHRRRFRQSVPLHCECLLAQRHRRLISLAHLSRQPLRLSAHRPVHRPFVPPTKRRPLLAPRHRLLRRLHHLLHLFERNIPTSPTRHVAHSLILRPAFGNRRHRMHSLRLHPMQKLTL